MNETFYWAAVWSGLVVSTVLAIVVLLFGVSFIVLRAKIRQADLADAELRRLIITEAHGIERWCAAFPQIVETAYRLRMLAENGFCDERIEDFRGRARSNQMTSFPEGES